MVTALIISILLLCVYLFINMKIAFPIYIMIATFPYKNIISQNCAWLDTCFELILLFGIVYEILKSLKCVKQKRFVFPVRILLFISVILLLTILFSLYVRNPWFILQTPDFKYYIGIFALCIYMYNDIQSYEKVIDLCHIFIINSIIMIVAGGIQYFSGKINRLYAFVHTNMSAAFFIIALFCCTFALVIKKMQEKQCHTYIYIACILINLLGLYFNRSSAALLMLAFAVVTGMIYLLHIERRKLYVLLFLGAVIISTASIWITIEGDALNVSIINALMSRKGYYDTSRMDIWKDAINQWMEHWLIGIGADNFRDQITGYNYITHNDYLAFLVNYGILGFSAFMLYSIGIFRKLFSLKHMTLLTLCLGLAGGMHIFMLTHNFVNWILFWVVIQMMLCIVHIEESKNTEVGIQ